VEEHGDLARELVDVLELEGRQLADDPRGRLDPREGPADVAGDRDVAAGGAEDRAEQLGRRRLAVRAGDADEARAREQAEAELDLAPDRDPARASGGDERRLARHARALDEEADAVEEREVAVVPELPVGGDDVHPAPLERGARGLARAREPEDEHARRQLHRSTRSTSGERGPTTQSTDASGSGTTSPSPTWYQTRGSGSARSTASRASADGSSTITASSAPASASAAASTRSSAPTTSTAVTSGEEELEVVAVVERERQRAEDRAGDPEAHHDLRLGPGLHLEMVMDRRHQERALAEVLEGEDLDHHGERLDQEDPADQEQQDLRLRHDREP